MQDIYARRFIQSKNDFQTCFNNQAQLLPVRIQIAPANIAYVSIEFQPRYILITDAYTDAVYI